MLEGDQATSADADRIRAAGAPVVQINTGTGCHLDAHMVAHGVERLAPPRGSMLLIENVGNLVCPALFDLGEQARVVVVSVTEGDDKPLKYPHMFRAADMLLINKIDLLPYVRFDMDRCITARTVDAIWHAAGDRSADFSWYTKRAILTGVYAATVLYWLRDTSDDDTATLGFLDRRLAGVGHIGSLRRRAEGALGRFRPA